MLKIVVKNNHLLDGSVNKGPEQLLYEVNDHDVAVLAAVVHDRLLELVHAQIDEVKLLLEQIAKVNNVGHFPAASQFC